MNRNRNRAPWRRGSSVPSPDKRIERNDAAAEAAAGIFRVRGQSLFGGRDRHEQRSADERRRTGDPRRRLIVDTRRPQNFPGHRVQRVDVGVAVADIGGPSPGILSNRDRRAHQRTGIELPIGAAGGRIERIDVSTLAADEHAAADDGRLGEPKARVGKGERPFELEARHIRGRKLRHRRRLKPALLRINAPPVPVRRAQGIGNGRRRVDARARR